MQLKKKSKHNIVQEKTLKQVWKDFNKLFKKAINPKLNNNSDKLKK